MSSTRHGFRLGNRASDPKPANFEANSNGCSTTPRQITPTAHALHAARTQEGSRCADTRHVARGENARFFLLDCMHFDGVAWRLPVDSSGTVSGITLACRFNGTCEATFTNDTFVAVGKSNGGQLINSSYSSGETDNKIALTFSKCAFDCVDIGSRPLT